jgi:hypothetical protein
LSSHTSITQGTIPPRLKTVTLGTCVYPGAAGSEPATVQVEAGMSQQPVHPCGVTVTQGSWYAQPELPLTPEYSSRAMSPFDQDMPRGIRYGLTAQPDGIYASTRPPHLDLGQVHSAFWGRSPSPSGAHHRGPRRPRLGPAVDTRNTPPDLGTACGVSQGY